MYPVLETEHLLLRSFQTEDFPDVFELLQTFRKENPENPYGHVNTVQGAKKITEETVKADNEFILFDRKTKMPVGWAVCDKAHGYKAGKRTFLSHWIREEYRHIGLGREILCKLMSFAFCGIGTQNVVTNVRKPEIKGHALMEEFHFEAYSYFPKLKPIDENTTIQYIISKETYEKQEYATICTYEYEPPVPQVSPYSYKKPIRRIDSITYIKQPTGYLCGQSVIAMLAGVTVEEVVSLMRNDKGTTTPELRDALMYYGLKTATGKRQKFTGKPLPPCCILSLQLPGYGHWSLYFRGRFYDPEFGEMTEVPEQAKLCYFWEVCI